ncbi:MAG TPA: hypothetical protein VNR38_06295 [Ureibacillus sp.]|nr:hypothetical protein [Ureibacillus sp.]
MSQSSDLKLNIHLYVILDLAIKSLQQDKKHFESFKLNRPYLAFCEKQISLLSEEFKTVSRALNKQGAKYEKYQRINKTICIYSFRYRGEILPFQYNGDQLLEKVEQKIMRTWKLLKGNDQNETTWKDDYVFRGKEKPI